MSYPISLVDVATGETLVIADIGAVTPFAVQSLQVGGADIRSVVNNRPQADGTLDNTEFAGACAVALNLTVLPSIDAHNTVDVLRLWARPKRRSWLVVQRTGWPATRRMLVRGDALAAPVTTATSSGPMMPVQLAFRGIDGVWEANEESSRTIFPGGAVTSGLVFPISFPISFGSGTPPGSAIVDVGGNLPVPPVIRIYGPVTTPGITNETTGPAIRFVSGFNIPAGSYVSIDIAAGTVLLNDDPSLTRFNSIDWSTTDLWQLAPGENQISFTGTGLSAVTQAVITWRERTA